jgi:hypothetical protein
LERELEEDYVITHFPLFGSLDRPITASTPQVKYNSWWFREMVHGQALTTAHEEHMVPIITDIRDEHVTTAERQASYKLSISDE